jgi:hypothetical protein
MWGSGRDAEGEGAEALREGAAAHRGRDEALRENGEATSLSRDHRRRAPTGGGELAAQRERRATAEAEACASPASCAVYSTIDLSSGTSLAGHGYLVIAALSYAGSITAATLTGITGTVSLVEGTAETAIGSNTKVGSLCRIPNGQDTNNADRPLRDEGSRFPHGVAVASHAR